MGKRLLFHENAHKRPSRHMTREKITEPLVGESALSREGDATEIVCEPDEFIYVSLEKRSNYSIDMKAKNRNFPEACGIGIYSRITLPSCHMV